MNVEGFCGVQWISYYHKYPTKRKLSLYITVTGKTPRFPMVVERHKNDFILAFFQLPIPLLFLRLLFPFIPFLLPFLYLLLPTFNISFLPATSGAVLRSGIERITPTYNK
jgi:hypothetical protein